MATHEFRIVKKDVLRLEKKKSFLPINMICYHLFGRKREREDE
jgi:hypothetical protein